MGDDTTLEEELRHAIRHFKADHLPDVLQEIVKPFRALAEEVWKRKPCGEETYKAIDHLLYAKDAAVRAYLDCPRQI